MEDVKPPLDPVAGPSGLQDSSSEYTSEDSDSDENQPEPVIRQELDANYENELENELKKSLTKQKRKKRKYRKAQSKLPPHLKGLMGEANLRFARGDLDIAEKMCYEVIRQEAYAHEPYQTLSQLYETTHPEKSLQYLTIAAHLNVSNTGQWLRLAQMYLDNGNKIAAVTCYTRAIQAEPKDYELHNRRITLLEELNDIKSARRCKVRLLQTYSKKEHVRIMDLAKELAAIYHKEKDYSKAVEIFSVPFKKCRRHVTPEMVNIYLELLLLNENYPQCLDVFVQYCNIEIEIMLDDDNKVSVLSYNMPDGIQIDLCMKFIVCLIKLDAYDLANKLLRPYLMDETNAEKIGDLYLDISEAFMSKQKHAEALQLLIPLIKSKNFSLAAVWLKYADCLRECKMSQEAIDSYFNVIRLAPQHIEVRYPLSELLLAANRVDEALEVLYQDANVPEIDVGLLITQIKTQQGHGKHQEYFKSAELLLKRHCILLIHETELKSVLYHESPRDKLARINKQREFRGVPPVSQNVVSIREPSIEEEYQLYRDLLSFCYKNRYYTELKRFAFTALSSTRFKAYLNDILVVALLACICNKDSYHAYPIIRDLLRRTTSHNNLVWNIYNLSVRSPEEIRQNRFHLRLSKLKSMEFLKLLMANSAVSSGSFKIATIYLMQLLKSNPSPFVHLMLGVVLLQISCQKNREYKKKLTQCSYGLFLHYANNRGDAAGHEVYYNLGRLYHQYGVLHIAAHYYKLVLEFKHPLLEQYPEVLGLKREAAFNLMLIYKDSENYIAARNLMIKYLTI